jgi:hypothetical protein
VDHTDPIELGGLGEGMRGAKKNNEDDARKQGNRWKTSVFAAVCLHVNPTSPRRKAYTKLRSERARVLTL